MGIEQIRNIKELAKVPKQKKYYQIPKVSAKKIAQKQAEKAKNLELENWFNERRKEMTGNCVICGGKTEKNNDKTFKRSIAHIFAKRPTMFPSVALHPKNFLELCFYGNSCHDNFDRNILELEDILKSSAGAELIEKSKQVYAAMTETEKNKVPSILMYQINK